MKKILFISMLLFIVSCKKQYDNKIKLPPWVGYEDETLGFIINNSTLWASKGSSQIHNGLFSDYQDSGNYCVLNADSTIEITSTEGGSVPNTPILYMKIYLKNCKGFEINLADNNCAKVIITFNNHTYNQVKSGNLHLFDYVDHYTGTFELNIGNGTPNLNITNGVFNLYY